MTLDELWEQRIKTRWPSLDLVDETYDQSHLHHTLFTVLAFGPIGVIVSLFTVTTASQGLACGIIGGLIGYAIRERWPLRLWLNRNAGRLTPAQDRWDGFLDVFVPLMHLGPIAAVLVVFPLPWYDALAIWAGYALVAVMYTIGRPGLLHYDSRKD